MTLRCEICGKRIAKAVFNSNTTADGNGKNKGECDACADDLRKTLAAIIAANAARINQQDR